MSSLDDPFDDDPDHRAKPAPAPIEPALEDVIDADARHREGVHRADAEARREDRDPVVAVLLDPLAVSDPAEPFEPEREPRLAVLLRFFGGCRLRRRAAAGAASSCANAGSETKKTATAIGRPRFMTIMTKALPQRSRQPHSRGNTAAHGAGA